MRSISRAAGLLALAVVAITCTDAPTGPGSHRPGFTGAQLAMAPSFSPTAARAFTALGAMGIGVTQARIRLRTTDGTVARDTTIQFGTEDTLHIQIPVEIQGTQQTFSALIELLDANGTVLFSQTQDVTARAATLPAAPPPTITLEYVGPGAAARSITVTPTDVTVQAGVEPVLTAVGTDAASNPVTDLLLAWTSSDATLATVTAVGRVATVHGTGHRGAVTITATSPTGLAGGARLAMLPPAARLAVISGDAQTSVAGLLLAQPLVVELQGADGGPIPDATVRFRAVTAGASVGAATATTDAAGRASTTLTLGRTAGAYSFEAAHGALIPVTIAGTATPAPATVLALVSGNAQVDSVGAALAPFTVRATDEFGATVSGAAITWERLAGLGTLSATTSRTGADGLASTTYVLGLVPGADTLRATITGATGPAGTVLLTTKTIARGANAIAITNGGGQGGLPGTTLATPLVAVVTDARGARLPGISVQWQSSIAGLVTFVSPVTVTDANGEARTAVTLGAVAGTTTVTASVDALSASTTLSVAIGAAANLAAVAGSGPGIVGATTLLKARVTDAAGNPVAGHTVSWAITAGGGTLPFTNSTTNALGEADITWTLGFVVGTQTVTATSSGLAGSPAVFTVDAATGSGSLLRLATQPGAAAPSGVVLGTQPAVQLTDATGTSPIRLAGVTVTAAVTNPQATLRGTLTAVTDSAGIATFVGLNVSGTSGTSTALVFSAPGYTSVSSNPLAIGPGVPATITAQSASTSGTVGLPVSLPPSVIVKDSTGNPVSGVAVSFAVVSGGGSISTTATTTDASGVASAASWVLGTAAGPNVVTATSGTLNGSPVRFSVDAKAGPASAMQFLSSPANTVVGATLSTVRVQLLDVYGNVATSNGDAVSLALDKPDILLGGKPTINAVSGIATFPDLFIGTAGTFTLRATSEKLPEAVSPSFQISLAIQVGSIRPVTARNQVVPIRGIVPKESVAFVVEDVGAKPMAGVLVSFRLGSLSQCTLEQGAPLMTDANGIVSTAVMARDRPGACEVTAVAGDARATSKIAVYGAGATHVWFGGSVEVDRRYGVNTNWLTVSDAKEIVPTSLDTAFVPNWETNMGPQLLADAALGGLAVEQNAVVDLGGFTLTTVGSVSAAGARVLNGLLVAGGDARVSGEFERLDVGRVELCRTEKATLDAVVVKELRVLCTADVAKQAEVTGNVDIGSSASLTVTGAFTAKSPATLRLFSAASFIVNGTATVERCTQTILDKLSTGVIIDGTGTINGQPALEFLKLCTP